MDVVLSMASVFGKCAIIADNAQHYTIEDRVREILVDRDACEQERRNRYTAARRDRQVRGRGKISI
ncbi:MAG: hypothetical protein NVS2B2_38380 [Ktedonobacteraceae bacterium]